MFPSVNPTSTAAWKRLQQQFQQKKNLSIKQLFESDPERFSKYSLSFGDFLFDYSKNIVDRQILDDLLELAKDCKLNNAIEAFFKGEIINATEKRAVLHTALRNFSGNPIKNEGNDVMPDVKAVLSQMENC